MFELTPNEREVLILRKQGLPFTAIGREIGLCTERARTIYLAALRKRRHDKNLRRNWGALYSYCRRNGVRSVELLRIVNCLSTRFESFSDLYPWDEHVEATLAEMPGIGPKTIQLLRAAYDSTVKIRPIAKPQVNEPF